MSALSIRIELINPDATVPSRGSEYAVGYDIYSPSDAVIPATMDNHIGRAVIKAGFKLEFPTGWYIRMAPRSGLAVKGIDIGAGVIDPDYRGEIGVVMYNFNNTPHNIKKGERIAQFILERCDTPDIVVVDKVSDTVRGSGGFGSSGN